MTCRFRSSAWTKRRSRSHTRHVTRAEGFVGERLQVVPRPQVAHALRRPGTSQLVVTDCGYFPRARDHGRSRARGAPQTIVILVTDGLGWCVIDGERHEVRSGQVLAIPANAPHEYGSDPNRPWTIWWIHVTGPAVPDLLASARITPSRPVLSLREAHKAQALLELALEGLEHDDSEPSMVAASGAAWHFLSMLTANQTPSRATPDPVEHAREYLQANAGGRIGVSELASTVGLSRSRFAELFRRSTGTSVLVYQTRLRMARARQLLDTSDMGVAAIARAVGYDDPYYFSRHFTRVHGLSPTAYRAHAKG